MLKADVDSSNLKLMAKMSRPVNYVPEISVQDDRMFIQKACFDEDKGEIFLVGGDGPGGISRSVCKFDEVDGMKLIPSMQLPEGRNTLVPFYSFFDGRKRIYAYGYNWSGDKNDIFTFDFQRGRWDIEKSTTQSLISVGRWIGGGIAKTEKGLYLAGLLICHGLSMGLRGYALILYEFDKKVLIHVKLVRKDRLYGFCVSDNYVYSLCYAENSTNCDDTCEYILKRCEVNSPSISQEKSWEKVSDFPIEKIRRIRRGVLFEEPYVLSDQKRKRIFIFSKLEDVKDYFAIYDLKKDNWNVFILETNCKEFAFTPNVPIFGGNKIWMIGGYDIGLSAMEDYIVIDLESVTNDEEDDVFEEERINYMKEIVEDDELCKTIFVTFHDGQSTKISKLLFL